MAITHGESWYKHKQNVDISQKHYKEERNLPDKMTHEEAVKYYNTKLFAYWMEQLPDKLSLKRKAQIVSLFMFGHTDRYELFKEKR